MMDRYLQMALGRPVYFKLVSWSLLMSDFFINTFPSTPALFLFRHPEEIMVANIKDKSGFLKIKYHPLIASLILNYDSYSISNMSEEEFCSIMLGRLYESILSHLSNAKFLAINYCDLNIDTITRIVRYFGVTLDSESQVVFEKQMSVHSKSIDKTQQYSFDNLAKRGLVTDAIRLSAAKYAIPKYEELVKIVNKEKCYN
jgi:hypothetical protein